MAFSAGAGNELLTLHNAKRPELINAQVFPAAILTFVITRTGKPAHPGLPVLPEILHAPAIGAPAACDYFHVRADFNLYDAVSKITLFSEITDLSYQPFINNGIVDGFFY